MNKGITPIMSIIVLIFILFFVGFAGYILGYGYGYVDSQVTQAAKCPECITDTCESLGCLIPKTIYEEIKEVPYYYRPDEAVLDFDEEGFCKSLGYGFTGYGFNRVWFKTTMIPHEIIEDYFEVDCYIDLESGERLSRNIRFPFSIHMIWEAKP